MESNACGWNWFSVFNSKNPFPTAICFILICNTIPIRPTVRIIRMYSIESHCMYCRISRKFACCRFIWIEKRDILLQIFDIRWRQDSIFLCDFDCCFIRISCRIRIIMVLRNPDLYPGSFQPFQRASAPTHRVYMFWYRPMDHLTSRRYIQLCFQLHGSLIHKNILGKLHDLSYVYTLCFCSCPFREIRLQQYFRHNQAQKPRQHFYFFCFFSSVQQQWLLLPGTSSTTQTIIFGDVTHFRCRFQVFQPLRTGHFALRFQFLIFLLSSFGILAFARCRTRILVRNHLSYCSISWLSILICRILFVISRRIFLFSSSFLSSDAFTVQTVLST